MSDPRRVRLPSINELTSSSSLNSLLLSPRATAGQLPLGVLTPPKEAPMVPKTALAPLHRLPLPPMPFYDHAQTLPPPQYQYCLHYLSPSAQHQAPPILHFLSPSLYYQPVFYASPVQQQQYVVPEVINKPNNKCHRCGTTETPEWRRGPNGVRTLCNACGLFHAKLVKRKGAALAAEEVLNNKVCKGKNGRRTLVKKTPEPKLLQPPALPAPHPQSLLHSRQASLPPPILLHGHPTHMVMPIRQ